MMEVGYVAHYQRSMNSFAASSNTGNDTQYPNTNEAVAPEMMTLLDKEAPFIQKTVARMARFFRS